MIKEVLTATERSQKKRALTGLPDDVVSAIENTLESFAELLRRAAIARSYDAQHPSGLLAEPAEACGACHTLLPPLGQPRRYKAMCLSCVTAKEGKEK